MTASNGRLDVSLIRSLIEQFWLSTRIFANDGTCLGRPSLEEIPSLRGIAFGGYALTRNYLRWSACPFLNEAFPKVLQRLSVKKRTDEKDPSPSHKQTAPM
jgi:hypothetical protein